MVGGGSYVLGADVSFLRLPKTILVDMLVGMKTPRLFSHFLFLLILTYSRIQLMRLHKDLIQRVEDTMGAEGQSSIRKVPISLGKFKQVFSNFGLTGCDTQTAKSQSKNNPTRLALSVSNVALHTSIAP
jgi:hypothetical protein